MSGAEDATSRLAAVLERLDARLGTVEEAQVAQTASLTQILSKLNRVLNLTWDRERLRDDLDSALFRIAQLERKAGIDPGEPAS